MASLKKHLTLSTIAPFTAVALASLMVVGCTKTAIKPEKHEPTKLVKLAHAQNVLQPIFHVDVGGEVKKDPLNLQIAYAADNVFIASRKGELMAFDATSGKRLWLVKVGDEIMGGVAYDQATHTLVVTTRQGLVQAFNATNGERLWQKQLSGTVLTPAIFADNRVLLSANDGVLYGLSLQTGQSIWQFGTQVPAISIRGTAKPVLLNANTALFATADGRIHAINAQTGIPEWSRRVGVAVGTSEVERMRDVDGSPVIDKNQLFAISYSGQMVAINLATGDLMFVKEASSLRSLTVTDNAVIATTLDGKVLAFDRQQGDLLWENDELLYRRLTNPVAFDDNLAVGDLDGVVHVLDARTGHIVSRVQTKGALISLHKNNGKLMTQSISGHVTIWQILRP